VEVVQGSGNGVAVAASTMGGEPDPAAAACQHLEEGNGSGPPAQRAPAR